MNNIVLHFYLDQLHCCQYISVRTWEYKTTSNMMKIHNGLECRFICRHTIYILLVIYIERFIVS